MTAVLRNGTVIHYGNKLQEVLDILILDIYCHLRKTVFAHKKIIKTELKSAVKGEFTSICPIPNTKSATDSAFILKETNCF